MSSTIKWKGDWGRALQLADDLWRIRLRHRDPAAKLIVNTYVHRGGGELVVIDPGWPRTIDRLAQALAEMGLADDLGEVGQWLYTHAHIDHMGAAALLGRRSSADHIAWSGLGQHLDRWHRFQDRVHDWTPWIDQAFVEPHRSRLLDEHAPRAPLGDAFGPAAVERADLRDFGDTIDAGALHLEFVDARGHDPHHGAFFEPRRGWLFSGDAVLAVPTPIARSMDDRLDLYRASLDRLDKLDAALLLPGHGLHRRDHLAEAFNRSRGFVDDYAANVSRALATFDAPVDLVELALAMTPDGQTLAPAGRWWVHLVLVDTHLAAKIAAGDARRVAGPRYRSQQ